MIKTSKTIKLSPPFSLEQLEIDIDKDWATKKIYNLAELSVGDIVFANGWRLTESENGIALIDNKGNIISVWTNNKKGKKVDK